MAAGIARVVAGRPRDRQVAVEVALLVGSIPVAFAARRVARELGASVLFDNWLVGRWPWFAAGMLLAVLHASDGTAAGRLSALVAGRRTWAWWGVDGPVITWRGTVSYGLFLWHLPIATWAYHDALPGRPWPALALTLALSVVAAAVSWYALERPLLRWAGRATRGR